MPDRAATEFDRRCKCGDMNRGHEAFCVIADLMNKRYSRIKELEAEVERLRAQVDMAIKRAKKRGLHTDVAAIKMAYQGVSA